MSETFIVHYMQFGHTACMMQPRTPKDWPEGHKWDSNWPNVTCPACLKGQPPYPDTFEIEIKYGKEIAITCKHCGKKSYHAKDIEQRYCGHCHLFHDDIWPPGRQHWIDNPEPPIK